MGSSGACRRRVHLFAVKQKAVKKVPVIKSVLLRGKVESQEESWAKGGEVSDVQPHCSTAGVRKGS